MRTLAHMLLFACAAVAQERAAVEAWTAVHQQQIIREFVELLSIPNVASDRAGIARNAAFLRAMLERRGMRAEIVETPGSPLVWGERNAPGAKATLIFYIH